MNAIKRFQMRKNAVFFFVALALIVYFVLFSGTLRFKEEVRLANGEMIVVKRKIVTSSLGEIGGAGGWDVKFNSFEIVAPDRFDNPKIWQTEEGLLPVLFDRDAVTGEWFLVSVIDTCDQYIKMGKPTAPYSEDRFRDGKWERVMLSPELLGRATNIFTSMRSDEFYFTVFIEVKELKRGGAAAMFRNILNDPLRC